MFIINSCKWEHERLVGSKAGTVNRKNVGGLIFIFQHFLLNKDEFLFSFGPASGQRLDQCEPRVDIYPYWPDCPVTRPGESGENITHCSSVNLIARHGPGIPNELFTPTVFVLVFLRPRVWHKHTNVAICHGLRESRVKVINFERGTIVMCPGDCIQHPRVFSFDTPAHSWRVFSILRRMCSHFLAQCPVSSYNSLIARAKINLNSWVATDHRETGTNWKLENMLNVKM